MENGLSDAERFANKLPMSHQPFSHYMFSPYAGTPYTVSVQALDANNGMSVVIPVYIATIGTLSPLNVSLTDPAYVQWLQFINAAALSGSAHCLNRQTPSIP